MGRHPFQVRGISRQLSPKDFPSYGPFATRELSAVSQASPIGSSKLICSGNNGARERVPQGRGLKYGSIRVSAGSGTIRSQLLLE